MTQSKTIAFLLAFLVIVIDQLTKFYALQSLAAIDVKTLLPILDFRLAMNHGVAFSLFSQYGIKTPWVLITFTSILSIAIAALILKSKPHELLQRISYGFILGGALGNLIDRIRFSAVVDFIDCHLGQYHWPVFNVADSFICVGAFLLIIYGFREGQSV
jgi:signal peptidase II